jgi:CRP/FNR family transcriptional regulator, cyclic AMP receptor protein
VLQHVRGSAVVGEVGLLDGSTRTADATVVTETTGWTIDGRQYADLRARYPELAQAAIRHLCALVRYTTDHIETIALYSLEARLARFLLSAVRRSHGSEPPARAGFLLDLNQSEIADLIGSSRPKVNRAMAALEKTGAIKRDGKTMSCDRDKLMRLAAMPDEE